MYETVRSGIPTAGMGHGIAWNHGCCCFWERVDGTASHRDQLIRSQPAMIDTSTTNNNKQVLRRSDSQERVLVTSGTSETLVRITIGFPQHVQHRQGDQGCVLVSSTAWAGFGTRTKRYSSSCPHALHTTARCASGQPIWLDVSVVVLQRRSQPGKGSSPPRASQHATSLRHII